LKTDNKNAYANEAIAAEAEKAIVADKAVVANKSNEADNIVEANELDELDETDKANTTNKAIKAIAANDDIVINLFLYFPSSLMKYSAISAEVKGYFGIGESGL
jgi:hypothetical protein